MNDDLTRFLVGFLIVAAVLFIILLWFLIF